MPGLLAADGQRQRVALLVALALAQAAAVGIGAAGTRAAFAGLDQAGQVSLAVLATILLAGLGLALLRPALRLVGEDLGHAYTGEIRAALLDHAMRSDAQALAARRRGYLLLRITGDMAALRDGVARGLPPAVQAMALVPSALAVLAVIDPPLLTPACVVTAICLAALLMVMPALDRAQTDLRRERARLSADMAERLPLAPDLALLGRRRKEMRRLRRLSQDLRQEALDWIARAEGLRALPGVLTAALAAWALYDGGNRGLAAGDLAAVLAALGILSLALTELGGGAARIAAFRTARARTLAALARPAAAAPYGTRRLRSGAITVQITDPGCELLTSPRLAVAAGESRPLPCRDPHRLALVLTRRAGDAAQAVHLDGIAIDELSPGSIRRGIETLSDTPTLIRGSLRVNLALGEISRPCDAQILSRIDAAGLLPALERLGGLDSRVAEGGRLHSPAERMLISALRLVIRQPGLILILPPAKTLPPELHDHLLHSPATRLWLTEPAPSHD